MKIGIVTTWSERGAGYVSKQYEETFKKQFDVYIYARGCQATESLKNSDSKVHWGSNFARLTPMAINKSDFKKWISKNNLDLIFFNEQQTWDPIIWCQEWGIKTGSYIDYYTEETIPFFGLFDFIVCNTRRHLSAFEWHPNALFIPWGTKTNLFKPERLDPVDASGKTVFFHSAGLSPIRKGTDSLLKAFNLLKSDQATLRIHAQCDLTQKLPDLTSDINTLVQKGRLEITNKTVSAPGLYHTGDVYVYPSRLEGIGLTIIEAQSMGLPIIVPDNPPMNEFIENGSSRSAKLSRLYSRADGYYWPSCEVDIDDLARQMQFFIKHHQELPKMKTETRSFAEKMFNWETNSEILNEQIIAIEKTKVSDSLISYVKLYESQRPVKHKAFRFIADTFGPFMKYFNLID